MFLSFFMLLEAIPDCFQVLPNAWAFPASWPSHCLPSFPWASDASLRLPRLARHRLGLLDIPSTFLQLLDALSHSYRCCSLLAVCTVSHVHLHSWNHLFHSDAFCCSWCVFEACCHCLMVHAFPYLLRDVMFVRINHCFSGLLTVPCCCFTSFDIHQFCLQFLTSLSLIYISNLPIVPASCLIVLKDCWS